MCDYFGEDEKVPYRKSLGGIRAVSAIADSKQKFGYFGHFADVLLKAGERVGVNKCPDSAHFGRQRRPFGGFSKSKAVG